MELQLRSVINFPTWNRVAKEAEPLQNFKTTRFNCLHNENVYVQIMPTQQKVTQKFLKLSFLKNTSKLWLRHE